jgi:hypothetical protein
MSKLHRSSINSVRKKPDIAIRATKAIGQRRRNGQKVTTMRIPFAQNTKADQPLKQTTR